MVATVVLTRGHLGVFVLNTSQQVGLWSHYINRNYSHCVRKLVLLHVKQSVKYIQNQQSYIKENKKVARKSSNAQPKVKITPHNDMVSKTPRENAVCSQAHPVVSASFVKEVRVTKFIECQTDVLSCCLQFRGIVESNSAQFRFYFWKKAVWLPIAFIILSNYLLTPIH